MPPSSQVHSLSIMLALQCCLIQAVNIPSLLELSQIGFVCQQGTQDMTQGCQPHLELPSPERCFILKHSSGNSYPMILKHFHCPEGFQHVLNPCFSFIRFKATFEILNTIFYKLFQSVDPWLGQCCKWWYYNHCLMRLLRYLSLIQELRSHWWLFSLNSLSQQLLNDFQGSLKILTQSHSLQQSNPKVVAAFAHSKPGFAGQ